jgi:hypothetical protein
MEIVIGRKSDSLLEQGYVFAPYIPIQTTSIVSGYDSKNINRKRKINKIFGLGDFSPSKSITSRYSTKTINSKYYGTIEIKKPTY